MEHWKSEFEKGESSATLDTEYELEDTKGRILEFYYTATLNFKETEEGLYKVDGGSDKGDAEEEIPGFISLTFQVDPRDLPKNWSEISMDIRDILRHEIEHLTHGKKGYSAIKSKELPDDEWLRELIRLQYLPKKDYFFLEKEVDAMLQGLYFRAKKSKTPFSTTINNYLDKVGMVGKDREDILKIWRRRRKALSLPIFEQEEPPQYTIYSDMDGVLTDFEGRFKQFSGIEPNEYKKKFGIEGFWGLIDDEIGVRFWTGMPWMPGGEKYWNYIKKHNPILLSSPSRQNESRLGKRLWKKRNMPDTKLILAYSDNKKDYADKNSILIDDYPKNIEQWRAAGGIGILHTSAEDTIKQLQKLGL